MADDRTLLERLTTELYEGVLTDDGWNAALRSISEATQSPQASVIVFNTHTAKLSVNETFGMPAEGLESYNAHYHQVDEALAFTDTMPLGGWYLDKRDLGERAIKKSEFYQDFAFRYDISTILCNRLLATESMEAYLSLQRRPGQRHYTEQELQSFQRFIPHAQKAVRIRLHMQHLSERAGLASVVLDRLQIPLLVLDDQGRILLTNTYSDSLLRQRPRLTVRNGCLNPVDLRSGQFAQMLQSACGRKGAAIARGALLPAMLGQGPLQLLVLPLPVQLHTFNTWARPLALVVLNAPTASTGGPQSLLQQLYGLTAAEARVAIALNHGEIPKGIAQGHGVSIGTVRIQIKSIFAKTGVNRQAELIRLMAPMNLLSHGL